MYKVFLNERIIIITNDYRKMLISPGIQKFNIVSWVEVPKIVNHFLKSKEPGFVLYNENIQMLWDVFKKCFFYIKGAGGVVIKNSRILFIYRLGKWDLPKGKIEKGEIPEQAAIRETHEECGILGHKIVKQLPSTWHIYESNYTESIGQWILKKTFWFEMEYNGNEKLIPQREEDITRAEWVSKNTIGKIMKNTYPNLEQIIRYYF